MKRRNVRRRQWRRHQQRQIELEARLPWKAYPSDVLFPYLTPVVPSAGFDRFVDRDCRRRAARAAREQVRRGTRWSS